MTAEDAKVFGIIGGLIVSSIALLLNFFSTMRSARGQRISNYQEIIKSHRDIWKLTLQDPTVYSRLFENDIDLVEKPISHQERLFSQLLFLHMSAAYTFLEYSHMQPIEKLELDFQEVLLSPIPRTIWAENRKYYNSDFRRFVEMANKPKGIKRLMQNFISGNRPNYTKPWNVLVLSAFSEDLSAEIKRLGDSVICMSDTDEEITRKFIHKNDIDFVVCFGYGRILKKNVLSIVTCINIHGGLLPYNRGPNPNLWAWIDNTKKGVSIHYVDDGVDTGDLIAQREIQFSEPITLQTAFDHTINECKHLFRQEWPKIRSVTAMKFKQTGHGSSHTLKSQKPLERLLDKGGLDMPIEKFRKTALPLLGRESIVKNAPNKSLHRRAKSRAR